MKNIAIELANRDRDLEKALGMSIEELEASVNDTVTTDFASIHKALVDAIMLGLDISRKDPGEGIVHMNKELGELMRRFPTLNQKLNNL